MADEKKLSPFDVLESVGTVILCALLIAFAVAAMWWWEPLAYGR